MKNANRRKQQIKKLSGWFCETTFIHDPNPENSVKKTKRYIYLSLTYSNDSFALFKILTFDKINNNSMPPPLYEMFITSSGESYEVNLYSEVIATHNNSETLDLLFKNYNVINNGDMEYTNLLDNDEKMKWINSSQDNVKTLTKLKKHPSGFKMFDFETEYTKQYDLRNPVDDNAGGNDEPTVTRNINTIATEASPGLWIINDNVTIASNEYLGFDKGLTVVTGKTFTNNGQVANGGTFCTSLNFTNNGTFTNNGGLTLNTGELVFNPSSDRIVNVYNREGNIINLGKYTRSVTIVGNQVQSFPSS